MCTRDTLQQPGAYFYSAHKIHIHIEVKEKKAPNKKKLQAPHIYTNLRAHTKTSL